MRLAAQGFVLTRGDVDVMAESIEQFRAQPNVAAIFLNHGEPFAPGDRLIQNDLAATLRAISSGGTRCLLSRRHRGGHCESESGPWLGLLTREDFAAYTVTESSPISCPYRGYTILSAPPPSSGGITLCEMLQILAGYPLKTLGFHSSESVHLLTEAMRHAYRDRNTYLGDPAFVDNPIARLLSAPYADSIRAQILPDRATPSSALAGDAASHETCHHDALLVVDSLGQRRLGDLHHQ